MKKKEKHEEKNLEVKEPKEETQEELTEEQVKEFVDKGKEYDSLWDKHVRLCADFENARRRWDREKSETIKFASSLVISDILTVVDEFEQALKSIDENHSIEEINKGVKMIYDNLLKTLKKKGLSPIEAVGEMFDPHKHEIVGQLEDEGEEHRVLNEVQKGYMFGDRVLRTAKVIISKAKQDTSTQDTSTQDTSTQDTSTQDTSTQEEEL